MSRKLRLLTALQGLFLNNNVTFIAIHGRVRPAPITAGRPWLGLRHPGGRAANQSR